jgi:hypothetical protein
MMKKILIAVVVILAVIQFIPVERSNPPVTQDFNAPSNVAAILKTSCYDCHSNETSWPWYAYVAPVSFFVASDVNGGRKRINFSEWDKYDTKKREKKLEAVVEVAELGVMPLTMYTFAHPNAKMDPVRIKVLKDWVTGRGGMEKTLRNEKPRKVK